VASLDGKVALVTGGASGIGERSVRLFVEQGARVVVADMQEERGRAVAASLGAAAAFEPAEVSREDDVRRAIGRTVERFGRLDVLFNNAGFGGALGPVDETPADEFDLTFAVLVRGVFLGMKHAAPIMKRQGAGSIVNTGSVAGLRAGHSPHAYAAAKAAVIHLTRSVALELAPHGVRVNSVCPGFIATPLAVNAVGSPDEAGAIAAARPRMAQAQPLERAGEPEDIAQAALWLASDAARFVTGQAIVVDGGLLAGQPWAEQPDFFKRWRPLRVYRPPPT
jgi:NAD(P)-dependent dehydrogenase (short-subunit alcohol dehydrogenase family)